MEFPMQEYWSGLPFPTSVDLPIQGSNHVSYLLHWQVGSLPLHHLKILSSFLLLSNGECLKQSS